MDKNKFALLLDKLLEKTEKGKLNWEKTAEKNNFLLALEGSAVSVKSPFDEYSSFEQIIDNEYIFEFRDETGNVIDSINVDKSGKNEYLKAEKLFDLVYKELNNSDQIVDNILEQLAA